MSTYKDITKEECAARIEEIKDPLIMIHVRPDGDCVGTACALAEVFRQLGEDAAIASADKIPDRLRFIIERTGARLTDDFTGRTALTVDVASEGQLGALRERAPQPTLMIDHHMLGGRFADRYIISDCSSAAEVLYTVIGVLIDKGRIRMTETLAYALYTAMSSDTGCFCYSNASPSTYRAAAELMECGIDYADINHRLFNSKSKEQIIAEGLVASGMKCAFGGKVAYATVTKELMMSSGIAAEHFETAIDIVRSLTGVHVSFIVKETAEGSFKVSLRSVGENVAEIAAKHGGGGHERAAGCTPCANSADEAAALILEELRSLFV